MPDCTKPGWTRLTEMPSGCMSTRIESVRPSMACLLATYAKSFCRWMAPASEPMLTTREPRLRRSSGKKPSVVRTTPKRLTANVCSVAARARPLPMRARCAIPALFTTPISAPPSCEHCVSTDCTARSTLSGSVTSSSSGRIRSRSSAGADARKSSPALSLRTPAKTVKPSAARR
eukprot:5680738-Prymnesium_polylepis.2